jgi:hypothetical protein
MLLAGLLWGCEGSPPGGSERAITVAPTAATLTGIQSAVFTAGPVTETDLALPLEWSVTNPALGDFVDAGGLSAVYQSTAQRGNNAVSVRDQRGAEGVAVVYQVAPGQDAEEGEAP